MKCQQKGTDGKVCGFHLDSSFKFCPNCGSKVTEETTPSDNLKTTDVKECCTGCKDGKFCSSCGTAVAEQNQFSTRRSSRQRNVKTAHELLGVGEKGRKTAAVPDSPTKAQTSPTTNKITQAASDSVRQTRSSPAHGQAKVLGSGRGNASPRRGRSAGLSSVSPFSASPKSPVLAKQPASISTRAKSPRSTGNQEAKEITSTRKSGRSAQAQSDSVAKESKTSDTPVVKPVVKPSGRVTRTRSQRKSGEDVDLPTLQPSKNVLSNKKRRVSEGTTGESEGERTASDLGDKSASDAPEEVTTASQNMTKGLSIVSQNVTKDGTTAAGSAGEDGPEAPGRKRTLVVYKITEPKGVASDSALSSPPKKVQVIELSAGEDAQPAVQSTSSAEESSLVPDPLPTLQQDDDKGTPRSNVLLVDSVAPESTPEPGSSSAEASRNIVKEGEKPVKPEPKISYTFRLIADSEHDDKILVELVNEPEEQQEEEQQEDVKLDFDPEPVRSDPEIEELIKSLKPVAKYEDYSEVVYTNAEDKPGILGTKMHSCKQCDFTSPMKKTMIAHLREEHGGFEPWKCPKCDFTAELKVGVVNHLASHSTVKPYSCDVCGKDFRYKQKLKMHMKYHLDVRDFECPQCNMAFHESKTLRNHIQRVHIEGQDVSSRGKETKLVGAKKTNRRTVDYIKKQLQTEKQAETDLQTAGEDTLGSGTDVEDVNGEATSLNKKTRLTTEEEELISAMERAQKAKIKMKRRDKLSSHIENDLLPHFLLKPAGDGINQLWECKLCSKVNHTKTEACDHMLNEHKDVKLFSCDICNYSTRHRSSLYLHKKTHSDDLPFACTLCHRRFKIKTNLRRHYNTHTNERNYQCTHCDKAFNNKDDVSKHIKRMHTKIDGASMFKCDICDKSFKVVADLNRHQRTHVNERTLPCPYCNRLYKTKESLNMHIRCHTTEYYCQICDKQIGSHSSFMAHKKLHDPEFHGYKCDMCDKVLQSKGSWQIHMRVIHSAERPFKCDVCGKSFKLKVHLERHKLRHSDAKPHSCDVCGFSCKRQEALRVHMRTHDVEKPYTCIHCGKGYTQKHALEAHVQMQHDERQFECGLCGSIFKALFQLQRHIRKYHAEHSNDNLSMTEVTQTVTTSHDSPAAALASSSLLTSMATTSTGDLTSEPSSTILGCETCQETFPDQHSLALHILTSHMDQKLISGGVGVMLTTAGSSGGSTLIAVNPAEGQDVVTTGDQEVVETELVEVSMDEETIIVSQNTESVEGEEIREGQ
ncbi:zinc finger protein 62 isoform X2 [Lingula anatina]|uniref:Zinc finger protein 62 isoform X2 n=1 Tax=Lingula anatina TaxID=7574 RepID=A0A1S3H4L6_LINAN|nr:zinc finger protein 62 isoform X2 [Lingula anatina]|eukprot:XP_013380411.1 zinc finger protein 62 isoform X2 [Lingula anatina]